MSNNLNNRRRALANVVVVDSWHEPFEAGQKVDLHADVVFGEARVGGEEESPIRFRLKVKRADVVVVIPESEPVGVEKTSVAIGSPKILAKLNETQKQQTHTAAKGAVSGSLGTQGFGAQLALGVAGGGSVSGERTLEVAGEVPLISVTLSKTPEGHYRWSVKPTTAGHLEGRPWDRIGAPRMKLIDLRKGGSKELPPTVRVEVRCRREDLSIEGVTIKNKSLWAKLTRKPGFKNKMAAAESYIRDRLAEEGLEVKNFPDAFGEVALASVIAESSR